MTDGLTPAVAEKALELLADHRVFIVGPDGALVLGYSAVYDVTADELRVRCGCPAGVAGKPCSHRAAAMVAWSELEQ